MRPKVTIVGGGWSGTAAAISAKLAGADVTLLERTDMLLGAGLVGGIMRNNGRFTAAEEAIALGGGHLFRLTDRYARHRGIRFPGHEHANLYDVLKVEPSVCGLLRTMGIDVRTNSRVVGVDSTRSNTIVSVQTEDGHKHEADVFIDATGTSGPMGNCMRFGNGCAMCVQRCPSFGPRVSLVGALGIPERRAEKAPRVFGAMSGSCKISKDSLAPRIVRVLNKEGVFVQKLPEQLYNRAKLAIKACQQYALEEFAESLVLLDTGHAKLMTSFFSLEDLRALPGFERARYADPYSGGKGNSIRFLALAPADAFMQVEGTENLLCAGEKVGVFIGHTEAIVTGTLAGHNAVRKALGLPLLGLPRDTAVGEFLAHAQTAMNSEGGLKNSYTFAGSVSFENLKAKGLYTTDVTEIRKRVAGAGLKDIFRKPLV